MKLRAYIAALHAVLFAIVLAVSPAGSGSMMLTGAGAQVASGATFSLTFESLQSSVATTATIDYGTMTYGSGCTNVVVVAAGFGATGIISISVNGVGGSAVTGTTVTQGGGNFMSTIWETSSSVSGSSGDVQITYSSAITDNSAVALYCLVTSSPTPSAGASTSTGNATSLGQLIAIPAGGGAVVGANFYGGVGALTPGAFTSATSDGVYNPGGGRSVVFDVGHTTSTGSITPTANVSPTTSINISVASWGP